MRKLFLAATLSILAPACAPADEANDGSSASADITDTLSIGPVCATDMNTELNRTGVVYVALCAGTEPTAEVLRVDLLSGTRTKLGTYQADQRVDFHDVSADTALWSASPAKVAPGKARPKSQVSFWTTGVGTRSFVPDDVLVDGDYHPADEAPFTTLGYAGHGRVIAMWGRIRAKVGLVDVSSGALTWQADGPTGLAYSTYLSGPHSADGSRWIFGQTLVDVGGASPRVVRLADSITVQTVYTPAGETSSWDGKSLFALLDHDTFGFVDLDTFVQTRIGKAASTDPLKPGRPAAASDGTIAMLTVSADHAKRSLQTAKLSREVPSTFQSIEYVAPGGAWAIAAEPLDGTTGASRHWVVDLAHPEAAMIQLDDGGRASVDETDGVITLETPIAGQHTLVRRLDAQGTPSAPVDVAGRVLPISADRVLVNGCYSTFDGANVTTDPTRCFANEQRSTPVPLTGTDRALVRTFTTTQATLSVVQF